MRHALQTTCLQHESCIGRPFISYITYLFTLSPLSNADLLLQGGQCALSLLCSFSPLPVVTSPTGSLFVLPSVSLNPTLSFKVQLKPFSFPHPHPLSPHWFFPLGKLLLLVPLSPFWKIQYLVLWVYHEFKPNLSAPGEQESYLTFAQYPAHGRWPTHIARHVWLLGYGSF